MEGEKEGDVFVPLPPSSHFPLSNYPHGELILLSSCCITQSLGNCSGNRYPAPEVEEESHVNEALTR